MEGRESGVGKSNFGHVELGILVETWSMFVQ